MIYNATIIHLGREGQTLQIEAITADEARKEAEESLAEQYPNILNKVWVDVRENHDTD